MSFFIAKEGKEKGFPLIGKMLVYTKRIEKMRWWSKLHDSESRRFCYLLDFLQGYAWFAIVSS